MKKKRYRLPPIAAGLLIIGPGVSAGAWQPLLPDAAMTGWQQFGGDAEFRLDGEEVVGVYAADTPNSFLATRAEYSDFILEYEVLADPRLNSGVQIRSDARNDGVVYGYQVEVDPSARAFSGGIYDEQRRGWLYPLSRNEKGRTAFRNGEWNRFRVEAVGDTIRVWVNGVQTADLVDDVTDRGFIALQVHSIDDRALAGKAVRWRNIRLLTEDLETSRWPRDPGVVQLSYLVNRLTDDEVRHGWRLLWDGASTAGWRGAKLDSFPSSGWSIDDGALTVEGSGGGEAAGPGDIVTIETFSDFELTFEFRITEGANSGVKYFVDPDLNRGPGSAIGCEFQILDDAVHPDAKMGVAGNRTLASLYDLIAAGNLTTDGRDKQFKGVGAWNHGRIVSRNGRVEHWLNHEKAVEFDRSSQMFRALVAYSKYKVWPGFCQWPEGHILLQDHGDAVSFRSIKIRES